MNNDDEPTDEPLDEPQILGINGIAVQIPRCCSEGRDDCPHGVQKERPEKQNVGL